MTTRSRLGATTFKGLLGLAAIATAPLLQSTQAQRADADHHGHGRPLPTTRRSTLGCAAKSRPADLPQPKEDQSVDNGADLVPQPEGAWPQAPAGFKVERYAQGFTEPRLIRTAPNGDLFLADSKAGKVMVLRGVGPDGKAQTTETFAEGLDHPFGINFYPAV